MPNPILLNIPEQFETERLLIRVPRAGDGEAMNAAVVASHSILQPWMPWAQTVQTVEDSEAYCRQAHADFLARRNLPLMLTRKRDGAIVGNSGLHLIDWDVPAFEIGYWAHIDHRGQGYITEAVIGISDFAFTVLHAARVEIRCDTRNTASANVAKRADFTLCGTFHNDSRDVEGGLRSSYIFEKLPHS
jgi:RimJ/RimL family protein N-acetyltransferase